MANIKKYANRRTHTSIGGVKYLEDDREVKLKHRILNWALHVPTAGNFGLNLWEWLVHHLPNDKNGKNFFTDPEHNYFFHLPTPVSLANDNIPLPREVARELVRRAKHRIMMDSCVCRDARRCTKYNHEIGCIVLGDIGKDFVPANSHIVSEEECYKAIDRGIAAGLMPTVARAKVDNFVFMTPDKRQMAGMCFCCDCCCAIPTYGKLPTETLSPLFNKLPGLEMKVSDECNGCAICAERCKFAAITVQDGRAVINERCTTCGLCASVCPSKAIEMTMTDPDAVRKIVDKIMTVWDPETYP